MTAIAAPRAAKTFRFVRCDYADGVASLVYAFDDGAELIERIAFPDAPALAPERARAFDAALDLLHLVAGVSYYKAGVPDDIRVESTTLDEATATFLDALYLHGLGEFAYHNKLDLRGRIRFPFCGPHLERLRRSACRIARSFRLAAARIRWSVSKSSSAQARKRPPFGLVIRR
jgi:hypothetical protein